jgi:hypothetical protein
MAEITWSRVLPVIISILIIIAIAVLKEISTRFAAVIATMPIGFTLGLWIVYSGATDPGEKMNDFTSSVLIAMIPNIIFIIVAWQAARHGFSLVPTLLVSYLIWGIGIGIMFAVRGT